MTQFDSSLRRALMDANLAQYENVLRRADNAGPDFSPRYLRERMRLLADPWGWAKRREQSGLHRRTRLNWRLIALIAALLVLSACAYAVATGQFSQWFPRLGVNPEAPETSEEVLSRTGTAIEQSQTVGDTTVTLYAAVWNGTDLWVSMDIESPNIPEEVQRYTPLYMADCRFFLRDDQWEEYTRNRVEESGTAMGASPEQIEADIQAELDKGQLGFGSFLMPQEREGNTLKFQENTFLEAKWFTETKRPELTLHIERVGTYVDGREGQASVNPFEDVHPGVVFVEGPFDLTFTLEEPILPIHYEGTDVEAMLTDIPLRFTGFDLSTTELSAAYEAVNPEDLPEPGPDLSPEENDRRFQATKAVCRAVEDSMQGLWTEDGKYVDLSNSESSGGGGSVSRRYPYPIDPATVTAVDIAGTRVELGGLERLDE
ncbi:MAG: DUF4179 domain-containing protein [Oscillibacter sp.]|nr:DUF4179 domain-containing protein [Oscillibacter sp.]